MRHEIIIVHCSDSPQGRGDDVNTIRRWHLERGFKDVGYHYVILEDGTIQEGRPIWKQGAHCLGHNYNSIGICLIGRDSFTPEQFAALRQLVNDLSVRFSTINGVFGHCDFDKHKTCPNFEV